MEARIVSKQKQEAYSVCAQSTGNWLRCETCNKWTDIHCMGSSSREFKFLERASNSKPLCNGCSTSGVKLGGGKCHEEITRGIEDITRAILS